jgi:Zn-dependent oligopeptidase
MVREMSGLKREILLASIEVLLVRTKAAIGTLDGSFLPTSAAEDQITALERAKGVIPPVDDIKRDFEMIEPLNAVARNAVVVHARVVDRDVRQAEIKRQVSTAESDAKLALMQELLKDLGDERNLEDALKSTKRNKELVERDPAQMDLVEETEKEAELAGAGA